LNWFAEGDVAVGVGRLAAYADAFGPASKNPESRLKTSVKTYLRSTALKPDKPRFISFTARLTIRCPSPKRTGFRSDARR
jgi:hypothetical protein